MGCVSPKIPTVSYQEVNDLPNRPEVLLIDVREPQEIEKSGTIPTSINIPMKQVKRALALNGDDYAFERKYGRNKPTVDTEIIFSCRFGIRAQYVAKKAVSMGYKNVKWYSGSWNDWEERLEMKRQALLRARNIMGYED